MLPDVEGLPAESGCDASLNRGCHLSVSFR